MNIRRSIATLALALAVGAGLAGAATGPISGPADPVADETVASRSSAVVSLGKLGRVESRIDIIAAPQPAPQTREHILLARQVG